jgi:hypothetical protein
VDANDAEGLRSAEAIGDLIRVPVPVGMKSAPEETRRTPEPSSCALHTHGNATPRSTIHDKARQSTREHHEISFVRW